MIHDQVEIVRFREKKFVGIPVTSCFQNHNPKRIEETKELFLRRKNEIINVLNSNEYVCTHFTSEVLFTYCFCMEVSDLADIPEGMVGFSVPAHTYAKVRSQIDPYEVIHTYLKNNGFENNRRALSLEVYQFEDPEWPGKVDVFIPIITTMNNYISRISAIEIPVSNLEESVEWYTQILGLQIQHKDANSAMLTFDATGVPGIFLCETQDSSRLHFINTNNGENVHSVIDFFTNDLKGFHNHLMSRGVQVGDFNINTDFDFGGFGFRDPDGNLLGACNAIQRGQI